MKARPFVLDEHRTSLGRLWDKFNTFHSIGVKIGRRRMAIYQSDFNEAVRLLAESGFKVKEGELQLREVIFYKYEDGAV